MPLLKIQTNAQISDSQKEAFLKKASSQLSSILGKSEDFVMTLFQPTTQMTFAGTSAPLAYIEVKSIGLAAEKTPEISNELCTLVESEFNISTKRIYIEFSNAERAYWGWNKQTF